MLVEIEGTIVGLGHIQLLIITFSFAIFVLSASPRDVTAGADADTTVLLSLPDADMLALLEDLIAAAGLKFLNTYSELMLDMFYNKTERNVVSCD